MPAALLLLLCAACNAGYDKKEMSDPPLAYKDGAASADSTRAAADNEDQQPIAKRGNGPQQEKEPGSSSESHPDWDKKIVKTADLGIEVKSFRLFSDRLHTAIKESGAYIAQEQLSQSASEIENTVTVKVPVDRFEDLLVRLPSDSDRLVSKKVSSEDVTMELVDTKSRVETKKEVRERYLDLLKQAHSMKDIIAVQNEINDIQQEMDQASGRIAWLGHSSAYSTINLHYYQLLEAAVVDNPSPGFIGKLKDAIAEGWSGLSALLLQMIRVWPLWIALVIGVAWLRKWLRGWQKSDSVVAAGGGQLSDGGGGGQPGA